MGALESILSLEQPEEDRKLGLETPAQYRERWISIRIMYYAGFLIFLAFGIVATGIWPYISSLEPTTRKDFITYIFATPPFCQLLFSPLFGWWANDSRSIRIPLIILGSTFTTAYVIYALTGEFEFDRKYVLVFARALAGIGTVTLAIARAYISTATRVSERTRTISFMSLAQSIGLLVGPLYQSGFSKLGEIGVRVLNLLDINMYTMAGWISVIHGVIYIVLLMPWTFNVHPIAMKEANLGHGTKISKNSRKSLDLNLFPVLMMVICFGLNMFIYVEFQT
ncbi:major facilitator superfamily domain-containing protein 8-like [Uranotaenia lowii]|uniref:major facilitator superfamily domain-containing protein 8-like n=1 Tax=Uranotaenia lowii TaxID=190385 RepID=UPI002478C2AB|nr:major facilitator superfamily domain-containing protein 8-like [Uranotaenia lowii]